MLSCPYNYLCIEYRFINIKILNKIKLFNKKIHYLEMLVSTQGFRTCRCLSVGVLTGRGC